MISTRRAGTNEKPPGESSPQPVEAKPPLRAPARNPFGPPAAMATRCVLAAIPPMSCAAMYGATSFQANRPGDRQADRDGRVEVAARHRAERVRADQHAEPERECDAEEPDIQSAFAAAEPGREDRRPDDAEDQQEGAGDLRSESCSEGRNGHDGGGFSGAVLRH